MLACICYVHLQGVFEKCINHQPIVLYVELSRARLNSAHIPESIKTAIILAIKAIVNITKTK